MAARAAATSSLLNLTSAVQYSGLRSHYKARKAIRVGGCNMTKWEYHVQDVAGEEYEDIQATLNSLGEQGWELVCTTETEESVCTIWMKRQKW